MVRKCRNDLADMILTTRVRQGLWQLSRCVVSVVSVLASTIEAASSRRVRAHDEVVPRFLGKRGVACVVDRPVTLKMYRTRPVIMLAGAQRL